MKKLLFTLFVFFASAVYGQMENPVTVSSTVDVQGGEATLTFKAVIEAGWHLYSTDLPAGGPTSATVEFETIEGAELSGALVPGAGEIEKDDPIFEMKVKYYENEATFTQKVSLTLISFSDRVEKNVFQTFCCGRLLIQSLFIWMFSGLTLQEKI